MFTGIVERTVPVRSCDVSEAGARLVLAFGGIPTSEPRIRLGDSIAVDGCCLTVVAHDAGGAGDLSFDVAPESLSRTTLGGLRSGQWVNVERSLRLGDRLDGHLVSGHVDGVAVVRTVTRRGIELDLDVELPPAFRRHVIEKGSIALAGVSLTVAAVLEFGFRVMLIPHTASVTTLGEGVAGTRLNFEVDPIGKWVARWMEPYAR